MICNTAQCFILYDKRTLRKHGNMGCRLRARHLVSRLAHVASAALDLLIQKKVTDLFSSNETRIS